MRSNGLRRTQGGTYRAAASHPPRGIRAPRAERLASILGGNLQDETHSHLTKQTIEHMREEILEHRRQLQLLQKKK